MVGGAGSTTAYFAPKMIAIFPTWEAIVSTIIIATVGATVGYFIKIALDAIFQRKKSDKPKPGTP